MSLDSGGETRGLPTLTKASDSGQVQSRLFGLKLTCWMMSKQLKVLLQMLEADILSL